MFTRKLQYILPFLILPVLAMFFSVAPASAAQETQYLLNPVRVYVFHSKTCPHCKEELKLLEEAQKQLPNLEVEEYEVSSGFRNQSLFSNVLDHYSMDGYVPVTVVGEQGLQGYDDEKGIGGDILQLISQCSVSEQVCDSWLDESTGLAKPSTMEKVPVSSVGLAELGIDPNGIQQIQVQASQSSQTIQSGPEFQSPAGKKQVRVFGREFNLDNQYSTFLIGIFLGLADGINPCMFSVLLFLLTYLLAIGSKKRALRAGIAFAITTFVVYFSFMLGIIKIVDILGVAYWLRLAVIIFALVAGLIMVKDFFFYGKWVSLDIPARFRPRIQALIKKGTLPSAIVLALFSSIVELPCTSGLPLAYAAILSAREQSPFGYLAVYNLFFILPLVIIIFSVLFFAAKTEKMEEKRIEWRKYMRLVSGILLLLLAAALWLNII